MDANEENSRALKASLREVRRGSEVMQRKHKKSCLRANRGRPLLLALLLLLAFYPTTIVASQTPIVAILSQPLHTKSTTSSSTSTNRSNRSPSFHDMLSSYDTGRNGNHTETYYIAASYVKWLEAVGIRSIVLPYNGSQNKTEEIFRQVNGLLLPGGEAELPKSVEYIWKLIVDANENRGDAFPVWGTCLGFEFMLQLAADSGRDILQSGFDAENQSLPLEFADARSQKEDTTVRRNLRMAQASRVSSDFTSRLFPQWSKIRLTAATENVTLNNHRNGLEPDSFHADAGLSKMFHIVSINKDAKGRNFVSTIEPNDATKHPFYGVQFHPEKNMFENAFFPNTSIPYENINHSIDGIRIALHLARFFADLVEKNVAQSSANGADPKHDYTKPNEYPLISTFPSIPGIAFEQIYLVP